MKGLTSSVPAWMSVFLKGDWRCRSSLQSVFLPTLSRGTFQLSVPQLPVKPGACCAQFLGSFIRYYTSWFGLVNASSKQEKKAVEGNVVTFVLPRTHPASDEPQRHVQCSFEEGQTVMEVAVEHGIPMEAACGGQCACTTCHVILKEYDMDSFPEPKLYEDDMLDLTLNSVDTSRLGCQLVLQQNHSGTVFRLPDHTWNQHSQSSDNRNAWVLVRCIRPVFHNSTEECDIPVEKKPVFVSETLKSAVWSAFYGLYP